MSENLENLKQKAGQLFHYKNWDELIPTCTRIIKLEKSARVKAFTYFRRGFAYAEKGNSSQAITDFTEALKLNPNHVLTYCYRGFEYDKKDDFDLAIADFTEVLKLDSNYAVAYLSRGFTYSKKGDFDLAIADFTKALKLDSNYAVAYLSRGFAYSKKGDLDLAIADSNKILELKPPYMVRARAHVLRGVTYLLKGEFLDAFDDFVDSNKYNPGLRFTSSPNYVASQIADIYKRSKKEDKAKAFKLYSKLLDSIIRIKEKQFYEPEEGMEVAHYTSLHTLKDLANKERFRFYNAAYMNDPEEGSVFFDIIKESGKDVKGVFYEEDEDLSYPSPAYIGSFIMVDPNNQEQRDKLFLWRTYGKHNGQEAAGACLIFRHEGTCFAKTYELQVGGMQQLQSKLPMVADDLKNPEEEQYSKPALYKIIYMDRETKEELSEELDELAKLLEQVESYVSKRKSNIRKNRLKRLTCELLDNIRFLFKASHYKEEQEVRVVQFCYYDENVSQEPSEIKVDTEQIPPHFYLDAHDNFRSDEVILGPEAQGVREWTQWLKKREIRAKKSKIKYGKQSF